MRRALLVACSRFDRDPQAFPPLRYSLADARRLGELLADPEYGDFDEVNRLENPRTADVRTTLERMARQGREGDLFLFFYSGHGKIDINGMLTLIMPESDSDLLATTSLPADELKRFFNMSRASQKVIVLDSCYSGAIGPEEFKSAPEDLVKDLARQTSGTFVITATTRFQLAHELESAEAGLLTDRLIEGVRSGAAAPPGSDCVTVAQIADYVADQVPQFRHQQPQAWQSGSTGKVVFSKLPKRFDEAWERSILLETSRLHANGDIDHLLADEIREVARNRADAEARPALLLLDALLEKKIARSLFALRWQDLRPARKAPEASPPPPPPSPPPPDPSPPTPPAPPKSDARAPISVAEESVEVPSGIALPTKVRALLASAGNAARRVLGSRRRWKLPFVRSWILLAVLAVLLLLPLASFLSAISALPTFEELKRRDSVGQSTRVRDAAGAVVLQAGPTFGQWIPYAEIPQTLIAAIDSAEGGGAFSPINPFASKLERDVFKAGSARRLILAAALDWKFSSEELLELYLNRTYFGASAYGADAASRTYFGHDGRQLSPGEAAVLAGIPKAPSRLNPFADAGAAMTRAAEVLKEMNRRGLPAGEWDPADALGSVRLARPPNRKLSPFTDWTLPMLDVLIDETVEPIDVWTTLDPEMQRAAQRAIHSAAGAWATVLVLDDDGSVRALAASGTVKSPMSIERAPGAMFDLFAYLARLEAQSDPLGAIRGRPGGTGLAKAFAGQAEGLPAPAEEQDRRAVRTMAERLGITSRLSGSLSMMAGEDGVRLLDLARAFATIQNKGVSVHPYSIRRITTAGGTVLYERQSEGSAVLSPAVVEAMTAMLLEPQKSIGALGLSRPIAARAALSPSKREAWVIGFAGGLTVAVCVGREDRADPDLLRSARSIFRWAIAPIVANRPADWFASASVSDPPAAGGREVPEATRGGPAPAREVPVGVSPSLRRR